MITNDNKLPTASGSGRIDKDCAFLTPFHRQTSVND